MGIIYSFAAFIARAKLNVILEEHSFPDTELSARTKCYSVAGPEIVAGRVGLVSKRSVTIMVHAVRKEIVENFSDFPIQKGNSRKKKLLIKERMHEPTAWKIIRHHK